MTSEANGYQPGSGAEWRGPSSPGLRRGKQGRGRQRGRTATGDRLPMATTRLLRPGRAHSAGCVPRRGELFQNGLPGWARMWEGTKRTKETKGTVAGRAGVLVMAVCSELHPVAVNCTKKNKKSENRGFNLEKIAGWTKGTEGTTWTAWPDWTEWAPIQRSRSNRIRPNPSKSNQIPQNGLPPPHEPELRTGGGGRVNRLPRPHGTGLRTRTIKPDCKRVCGATPCRA